LPLFCTVFKILSLIYQTLQFTKPLTHPFDRNPLINLRAKFEGPSFVHSKDMSGPQKVKNLAVAEMGNRLATIDMDRKVGPLLCPSPWVSWVPI